MNRRHRVAVVILAVFWLGFAGYVSLTAPQLPESVATHFGAGGKPNGWMTRAQHLRFTLAMGTALPAFILGVFAFMRRRPDRMLNIPNRDHWLAPDRREATFDFVQRCGYWLAGLLIAFLAGLHHSILAANSRSPVALSPADFLTVTGVFLAALVVWIVLLCRRFSRKPA